MEGCIAGCKFDGRNWYKCNYCGERHCSKHRLPEKHDCVSISTAKTLGPEFRDFINESGSVVLEEAIENRNKESGDGREDSNEEEQNDQKNKSKRGSSTECVDCGSYTPRAFDFCLQCRKDRGILTPKGTSEDQTDSERKEGANRKATSTNNIDSEHDDQQKKRGSTGDLDGTQQHQPIRQSTEVKNPDNSCIDCSATIPDGKQRCIDCRRKHSLIDHSSPDVSSTGDLVHSDGIDRGREEHLQDNHIGPLDRLSSRFLEPLYIRIRQYYRMILIIIFLLILYTIAF